MSITYKYISFSKVQKGDSKVCLRYHNIPLTGNYCFRYAADLQ